MLSRRMLIAGMALGLSICGVAGANAEELPDLPPSAVHIGEVCTSGQLIKVGLAAGTKLIVRANSGLRIGGGLCSKPLVLEAVPWVGAVYEDCQAGLTDTHNSAPQVKGWCLRDNFDNLTLGLELHPSHPDEAVELFYCQGNEIVSSAAYRGSLSFHPTNSGQVQPVNILPLESYLSGVVPREVPAKFHPEALRAMTCVARSYTLTHLGQHRAQGFDLCDSVHCQVYGGLAGERASINAIVAKSAGQVLVYGGKPIDATYHAVCGGWGAAPQDVWAGRAALPYLQARTDIVQDSRTVRLANLNGKIADCFVEKTDKQGRKQLVLSEAEKSWRDFIDNPPQAYCGHATRFRWRKAYDAPDLLRRLRVSLPYMLGVKENALGSRLDVRVSKRAPGGRVLELVIATELGEMRLGGDKVRWLTSGGRIGADGLQSSLFYVTKEGQQIVFKGCGWGHGVGLCQEGAQGRALSGQSAEQILQHYYPGANLQRHR